MEIHSRDRFIGRLFSILVLDDHAQTRIFRNAAFERLNERPRRMNIDGITGDLVNSCYDQRVVQPEVFTADCAALIGT